MKLLIVDDSSIIRSRIARIALHPRLTSLSIVGLANNGVDAVTLCRSNQPDLVTMDLTMPEMDGIACIDILMADNPNLNILVVSALSDKTTALMALKKGARGFLCKPFSEDQLLEALIELTED